MCQCKLSNCLTNAFLWWGILMVGEAGFMWGQAIYRKSLYLLLSFTVNLKNKLREKEKHSRRKGARGKRPNHGNRGQDRSICKPLLGP